MQNTPSIGKEYTYITIRKAKSSAHHSLFLRGVNYVGFFFPGIQKVRKGPK